MAVDSYLLALLFGCSFGLVERFVVDLAGRNLEYLVPLRSHIATFAQKSRLKGILVVGLGSSFGKVEFMV